MNVRSRSVTNHNVTDARFGLTDDRATESAHHRWLSGEWRTLGRCREPVSAMLEQVGRKPDWLLHSNVGRGVSNVQRRRQGSRPTGVACLLHGTVDKSRSLVAALLGMPCGPPRGPRHPRRATDPQTISFTLATILSTVSPSSS
jgi:hypothetical protein